MKPTLSWCLEAVKSGASYSEVVEVVSDWIILEGKKRSLEDIKAEFHDTNYPADWPFQMF